MSKSQTNPKAMIASATADPGSISDQSLSVRPNDDAPKTVADLPGEITDVPALQQLADVEIPQPKKDPVKTEKLSHRAFDDDHFWQRIPAFENVSRDEFVDYKFQMKHSAQRFEQLEKLLKGVATQEFVDDVRKGLGIAPMNMRLSPYVLSLIDWEDPYNDPIRIQFIPVASTRLPDHPRLTLDSLHEQDDSPTPGLVHRYPDKVLFLPLDVCPVYCRFCTRSYAIGGSTAEVEKEGYRYNPKRWDDAFAYLASRREVEDVVISGGDSYMLAPAHLRKIGETLLSIPHIRRIRFASKGLAVMPQKVLSHDEWTATLLEMSDKGRDMGKEVCLHTHFNSAAEITDITREAMDVLFKGGLKVRNQSVFIRGVNDDRDEMVRLVKQLGYMNVQPYYVYQHDMVKGVEELRTRVADTQEVERYVRGCTAGFNTPTFVTDVPGGGGKRGVHSFDYYDKTTGVSVYRSPSVDENKVFTYFDPIDRLPEEGQRRWDNPTEHQKIVDEAIEAAGLSHLARAT